MICGAGSWKEGAPDPGHTLNRAAALSHAAALNHGGSLSAVLLAALVMLVLGAFEGLAPLPAAARTLRGCAESARRLDELRTTSPSVSDPAEPQPLPADPAAALTLREVSFAYDDTQILDRVSFSFAPGCRVALTGSSGAGKSTLAQLLVRFADPSQGRVMLGDQPLETLRLHDLRSAVVLAAQDAHVFTTTVRENLLLANREASEAQLWEALAAVQLDSWVRLLPQGIDTLVGEDGKLLSGGQRQRLTLARALVAGGRFLVLDEPTAHLDQETAAALMRGVDAAAGERGVIVITHRLDELGGFDAVLALRGGQLTRIS